MIKLPGYKVGDVLGFSGFGCVSNCINIATYGIPHWGISHVGVVGASWGRLWLYESTASDEIACEVTGRRFRGVQAHGIRQAIEGYRGRVWHYPLYRSLYAHEADRLNGFLNKYVGTPYDTMGAFRSAGIGLSWIESLFRMEDMSEFFCSEMGAAAFSITGIYPVNSASRWNPNRFCRVLRRERILRKPVRRK